MIRRYVKNKMKIRLNIPGMKLGSGHELVRQQNAVICKEDGSPAVQNFPCHGFAIVIFP